MHRISVITPSYKQLSWLKLCAASVADQAGVEVEHIIQDAGTGPELETWASSQPQIKLKVEADAGMYDAINRGLKRATGEICAYLNCDEQYLPGTLRRVADYFAAHPEVEVLFADAILIDCAGQPLAYRRMIVPSSIHTRLVHLGTLSASTFFRRSIIERNLLFDPQWKDIGDAVWVDQMLKAGVRMAVLPQPLSVFAFTGANMSTQGNAQAEGQTWRRAADAPSPWLTIPAVLWHRFRKLLAGAYSAKSFVTRHYTPESPDSRKCFNFKGIHFSWPGNIELPKPVFAEKGQSASDTPPKIAAVFSTFNRSDDAYGCISRLGGQTPPLHRIVVADNGSSDGTSERLRKEFGARLPLEIVSSAENLGNPGGLRLAIRAAIDSGAEWIWILDDDSWPRPDALKNLLQYGLKDQTVYSSLVVDPKKDDLAWPCPVLRCARLDLALSTEQLPKEEIFEIKGAWLGALIPASIINEVGELDSSLFIRGEDEEYPARIREHGFRFLCVPSSILDHPAPNKLLRLSFRRKNFFYEPRLPLWKSYYAIRNQIHVRKTYASTRLGGYFKGLSTLALSLLFCVAVDNNKWNRLKMQMKAGWHGLSGKLGKCVEPG